MKKAAAEETLRSSLASHDFGRQHCRPLSPTGIHLETTRLSSKGQLVLPKPVRETLGWTQGMEFRVEANKEGVLLRPVRCFERTTLREVVGSAGYSGRRMTPAEMENAIRKGMSKHRAHGRLDSRR